MRVRVYGLSAVGLCLLGMAMGCGSGDPLGRKAISGTVTLDGTSVKQGVVTFTPMQQGGVSSGAPIADGKYSIAAEKGLPKGKYRVTINASDAKAETGGAAAEPGAPTAAPKELVPPDWSQDSKHEVEVGDNKSYVFDFPIKSK